MLRRIREWWQRAREIPLDGHGARPTTPRPLPAALTAVRGENARALAPGEMVAVIKRGHIVVYVGCLLVAPLSGCAGAPALRPVCPALVTYSAADQKALRAELDAHQDTPQAHRWIADYVGLRDQVRVCVKAAG
ncbi:hypothetical protein [Gluconacetobacter sacchari]|uniref:Uncharacterized protein n=3 Tax=Gluconacetobacter sacchari TaxID=92759 RepID=A0A7W4IC54_9PROT|nr:hypothetical protein [Gluconacetobacter sacchari]MBB2160097.1 hypothetical protein [Gluconacetobacter sacchari]